MTETSCADPSFGINAQALAILQLLAGEDPTFADYEENRYLVTIKTFPWYNGRENGVALTVQAYSPSCLVITFGENRASDQVFVEYWVEPCEPFNQPTPTNRHTRHTERITFPAKNYGEVVSFITDVMSRYYKETRAKIFEGSHP